MVFYLRGVSFPYGCFWILSLGGLFPRGVGLLGVMAVTGWCHRIMIMNIFLDGVQGCEGLTSRDVYGT